MLRPDFCVGEAGIDARTPDAHAVLSMAVEDGRARERRPDDEYRGCDPQTGSWLAKPSVM